MFQKLIFAAVIACLAGVQPAAADEPAPLTDENVKGFIASFPDIKALGQKFDVDPRAGRTKGPADFSSIYRDALDQVREKGAYEEMSKIVQQHGFSSPEQWSDIASRVMKAYLGISMGDQAPQMNAQMKEAMRRMATNPNIPAEQRDRILAQMRNSSAMMSAMAEKTPDWDVVRPHVPTLKAMIDKRR